MAALADIDELYTITISKLPIESRLSYCIKHLDKIQSVLTKNMNILHPELWEKYKNDNPNSEEEEQPINPPKTL